MSTLKGLIFDKDGTLFDFAATWESWAASFLSRLSGGDAGRAEQLGRAIDFDLARRQFAPDSVVIAGTPDQVAAALLPHCPEHDARSLMAILNDEAAQAPQQPAVPLVPLLSDLRSRGLRLGVATNDAETPARAHLGAAGVTADFDFIAGSDTGFGGKPGPGQLLAFAEAQALDPAEIAMVGDSTHDLLAARNAGMPAIAVLTGYATEETLAPLAQVVLPDIGHLPEWLDHHTRTI